MSYNIEIYTKKNCPYCTKAKCFLKEKALNFTEISVDSGLSEARYLEMQNRSGGCLTVPQIFINDYHVGGSDDLLKLDSNKLNLLLRKNRHIIK